jgi:ribosome recycling factor
VIDDVVADAQRRMDKTIESTRSEFGSVRTGRASAGLLDRIQVSYYGTKTPLNQLAQISVPEPRMLAIQPYDKGAIKEIERAILESDLGLTPANDGATIRLPVPQLTEQRRKDLVKVVGKLAEEGRIALRNVRREAIASLKDLERDGQVGSDELHRAEDRMQKLTDEHVKLVDELYKHKETEILEV